MGARAYLNQLGGRFAEIAAEVTDRREVFPSDGYTLSGFGFAHLDGVPPDQWDTVTMALHRRGAIWTGRSGGIRKVFLEKPKGVSWALETTEIDELWTKLAKHVSTIIRALRDPDQAAGNQAAFAAAERFVNVCSKAIRDDGVTLADIRADVMDGLSEKVVAVIVNIERSLALNSHGKKLLHQCFGRKQNDPETSVIERVYKEIERRGKQGATRSNLFANVRPAPTKDDIAQALDELEGNRMISMTMQKGSGLRRAKHYFATS